MSDSWREVSGNWLRRSSEDVGPRRLGRGLRFTRDAAIPRDVYVLSLVAFIVALGFGVVGPAIPLLADSFGVGKTAAATAISAFAFFRFVSAIANGRLVEIFSARAVLATGLVTQAVTTVLAGLAPTFTWVVVFRSVGGLGSAAFTVAAMSLLLRIAPPTHRGRAVSLFQGGFLLGAIFGPAAGGFLAEVSPRVPFIVYGVFLSIAGTVGMAMLSRVAVAPAARELEDEALFAEHADEGGIAPLEHVATEVDGAPLSGPPSRGLSSASRRRAVVACLVANFGVGWMLYGVRGSLMPIYVIEALGKSAVWAGAAFFVGSVAQALVLLRAGKLVDTWGRRPTMLLGSTATCLAVSLLLLPPQLMLFITAMAVFGAAGAFLGSSPGAVLADIGGSGAGRLVAGFQMSSDAGAIIGPLAAGLLADEYGYAAAFGLGAGVLALGVVGALLMPETGPPRASRTVAEVR